MGTRRPGPIGCDTTHRRPASPLGPLGICATTAAKPQPPRARRKAHASTELPILRRGTQGGEVQKLQRQLNARLMPAPKLAVDGIFGPITHRAVVDYQKAMSIDADGIVGKLTWYHLLKGDKATVRTPEPVAAHAHAGTPPAAAPMLAAPPATKPGVWEWPLEEKFAEALRRTAPKLDGSVREEFKALLTPGALAMMAGTLVVWAASHAFGVGAVVDVLLLLTGIVFLGIAAFDVAEDLGDFVLLTSTASSDTELEQASTHLSRAIAVMGVAAFMALLAKVAARGRTANITAREPNTSVQKSIASPKAGSGARQTNDSGASVAVAPTSSPAHSTKIPNGRVQGKYDYTKPGPLPDRHAGTFAGHRYEEVVLTEPTSFYRVHGGEARPIGRDGTYVAIEPQKGGIQSAIDYALLPEWKNSGTQVSTIVVPAGTKVYVGSAAYQGGPWVGGKTQVYIPPSAKFEVR